MQSIVQLEANIEARPNSIEIHETLADEYVKQGRWEDAVRAYQKLLCLYPATAALFVNRIRLGAAAMAISSVLVLIAELVQPPLAHVNLNPFAFAQALSSPEYLTAQILLLLAFPLFSTSAISLYKLLSYTHDHRPAFWAMVFSVIGAGLSMPALGINAIVLPLSAGLYLAGELDTLKIYFALQTMPWSLFLHLGGYIFVFGIAIFSWVILRNKNFPGWSAVIFLAGWILFIISANTALHLEATFIGLLIFCGGSELARNVWMQASLQFKPLAKSPQKADL